MSIWLAFIGQYKKRLDTSCMATLTTVPLNWFSAVGQLGKRGDDLVGEAVHVLDLLGQRVRAGTVMRATAPSIIGHALLADGAHRVCGGEHEWRQLHLEAVRVALGHVGWARNQADEVVDLRRRHVRTDPDRRRLAARRRATSE